MEFERFVRERVPALVRFASAMCADRGVAEDVVQEVLLRLHGRWATISHLDALDADVRRAVVNEYLSWRRKWARVIPHDKVPEHRIDVPDLSSQQSDRSMLSQKLASLPSRQRAVLVLRFYQGLSDAEIAAVLGCRAVTVRGYASRALSTLRVDLVQNQLSDHRERS